MALPSESNKKPISQQPIDTQDPFYNTRASVVGVVQMPLVMTNNWLINYVAALEERMNSNTIPVGTVIDWLGAAYNLTVPAGYWPCDGTVINDKSSSLDGKKAPDLRNITQNVTLNTSTKATKLIKI